MRAHRTALLAYRASSMAADCIVSRAPCCHAGGFRASQSQEVIALARRDSLAGRSSSSFLELRLMSHGSWAGCHEPKGTDGFHTRSSAETQPRLLNIIRASTNLDDLLTIIEKNHSYLNAAAVRESLQKAANLEQKQRRSLSRSMRHRLKKVVSQHLERHMTDRISDYSAFDLASCAHKLAKMRLGGKATFQAIVKEAIIKLAGFDPRGLVNLLWAYAKAEEKAPRLFEAVEAHLHSHTDLLQRFKPQDFSNLVWAYAKAEEKAPRLFQAVEAHLHRYPELLNEFNPQDFSNLVHAYAKAGEEAPRLFQAVEAHLHRHPGLLKEFNPQDFSSLVWAFATAEEKAPRLFQAVEAHLHRHPELLKGFKPQGFSNLVWAFAKAEEKAPRLFQAVEAHLHSHPELLKEFKPQELANLVHAYAKAWEEAPRLFQAVEAYLHRHPELLKEFNPQELSNLVWAFATAGEKAPRLFEAVDVHLQNNPGLLRSFNAQAISNVVWACAEQRHDAPGLFDLISRQVVQRLNEFSPQGLSMMARAYAVLYHPRAGAESIIQATLQRAERDPNAFTPQALANIMNAAAVVEKLDASTLKVLASAMASMELQEEEYCSVYQSCLGLQLSSPDSSPASLLPGAMHDSARHLWQKQAKDVRPSELQKDVLRVLSEEMGLKCHPEWMTPDGNFSLDIMVELPVDGGRPTRVAVEVDGPSHFTSTTPFKALGSTRLKRRLLEARVDHVVSVPFYEWNEAAKSDDASAKKKLLERIIFTSGK